MPELYFTKPNSETLTRIYCPRDRSKGTRKNWILFPFSINISELDLKTIESVLSVLENDFGGKLFRDRDLFWCSHEEYHIDGQALPRWDPRRQIFLCIQELSNGTVRINLRPGGSMEGGVVYNIDDLIKKVDELRQYELDYRNGVN